MGCWPVAMHPPLSLSRASAVVIGELGCMLACCSISLLSFGSMLLLHCSGIHERGAILDVMLACCRIFPALFLVRMLLSGRAWAVLACCYLVCPLHFSSVFWSRWGAFLDAMLACCYIFPLSFSCCVGELEMLACCYISPLSLSGSCSPFLRSGLFGQFLGGS